jgi:DNA helicase HerA-like ATPase
VDQRPAVVILDGEPSQHGDSSEFSPDSFDTAHTRLGEQLGGSLLDQPNVREVIVRRSASGLAFSFGDIKVEDIVLLLPPLTETSANVLRRILKHIPEEQTPLRSLKDVLEHLRNELHTNKQMDGRTARAIAERLMSPQVELLENVAPDAVRVTDLLTPGAITVLNVVDLDDDQRKVVALYLLLAFEKLAEHRGINTLLVLDEAEKLFPRRLGGSATPTTIQRLAGRIGGIARRGRRRRFGMMVCTQTPADVHGDIVSNCDIKIVFNVSGQDGWLRENLGADLVQGAKSLGTGECYVDLRKVGVSKPVRTRLFRA